MIEIFAWWFFVGLLLLVGAVIGIYFSEQLAKHRRQTLDEREAKLQTDWNALLTAQRLNAAFMEARKAMWEEAVRHHQRPRPNQR